MPYGKHRIPGTVSEQIEPGKPTRYRFVKGTVKHNGKSYRRRLGFRGNKVTEVSFIPAKGHEKRKVRTFIVIISKHHGYNDAKQHDKRKSKKL